MIYVMNHNLVERNVYWVLHFIVRTMKFQISILFYYRKKSNVDEANKESDGRMMTGQINK
jgi:hypothetical protein